MEAQKIAIWTALSRLAVSVTAVVSLGLALPTWVAAETCLPDDPLACLARCRLHKAECVSGCRARKQQCVAEIRIEVRACRAQCRLDEGATPEEVSACKRRCVAEGLHRAHDTCRLGHPSCIRLCHPEGCGELCGLVDAPADPAATSETTRDDGVCEPPVDRECLGACAKSLRECAASVVESSKQCFAPCRVLSGVARYECIRECADKTAAAGRACRRDFRGCVTDCGVDPAPEEPIEPQR